MIGGVVDVGAAYDFVFLQPINVDPAQHAYSAQSVLGVEDVVKDTLEIVSVVGVAQLIH